MAPGIEFKGTEFKIPVGHTWSNYSTPANLNYDDCIVSQPRKNRSIPDRLEAIEILLEKILARLPEVPARRVRAVELNKENFDE